MKYKYTIISSIGIIIVLAAIGFAVYPLASRQIASRYIAKAGGGCPYQIGLTQVEEIPCVENLGDCEPLVPLCGTLDPARCNLYSEVIGEQAGGMGSMALFQNIALVEAGLTPGGQLIACGMGPTLMDTGVLASAGGCFGCLAKANVWDKIGGVYDYIIASFRSE